MASPIEAVGVRSATAVTKSDSTVYAPPLDALYIGGAGNVVIRTAAGETVTFAGAVAGSVIPVRCDKVMSTDTTATSIVGLRF